MKSPSDDVTEHDAKRWWIAGLMWGISMFGSFLLCLVVAGYPMTPELVAWMGVLCILGGLAFGAKLLTHLQAIGGVHDRKRRIPSRG